MEVSGQHHAPAALYPGERTPGTHWTGGWVGPRADLDAKARRKILCLCRGLNPGRPVRSQTLYWLSYPGYYILCINIKMDLRRMGCDDVHWILLTLGRFQWWTAVNMIMDLRVPNMTRNFLGRWATVSLWKRLHSWNKFFVLLFGLFRNAGITFRTLLHAWTQQTITSVTAS
jgi:hypothetical protein